MTYYKEGTNIKFDEDDLMNLTLARLSRIAHKGIHPNRYVFLVHEVREVLTELVRECILLKDEEKEDVKNTPIPDHEWPRI